MHTDSMNNERIQPTVVEVSRETVNYTQQTAHGPYEVRCTTVIKKQTWPDGCGVYSGRSYELGSVYHNGNLISDWNRPWEMNHIPMTLAEYIAQCEAIRKLKAREIEKGVV